MLKKIILLALSTVGMIACSIPTTPSSINGKIPSACLSSLECLYRKKSTIVYVSYKEILDGLNSLSDQKVIDEVCSNWIDAGRLSGCWIF